MRLPILLFSFIFFRVSAQDTTYYQQFRSIGNLTPNVSESSSLLYDNGYIWTHNDGGNGPVFYKIDPATAQVIQTITVSNFTNQDWEDIASDSSYFYIGDFGNNDGIRSDLKVLRIPKSQFIKYSSANLTVAAEAINFSYSDQLPGSSKNNFDCEAITSVGDSLYLFSKDKGDYKTRVYRLPKIPGSYKISPYTSYDVKGLITGADYDVSSHIMALIGYQKGHVSSFIDYLSNFKDDRFFSGNKQHVLIGNSLTEWQTEGICFKGTDSIYISCESTSGLPASLYTASLEKISNTGIRPLTEQVNIVSNANEIRIACTIPGQVYIFSVEGRLVKKYHFSAPGFFIGYDELPAGRIYLLDVETANGTLSKKYLQVNEK